MRAKELAGWSLRLLAVVLAACGLAVRGAVIEIQNPSFEEQWLQDGAWASGGITGWTLSAGVSAGVQNPVDGMFSGTSGAGPGMPDGEMSAWMNTSGYISQTLAETLKSGRNYKLTVMVGDRKDTTVGAYSVQLYAGTTLLGATNPPTVNDGWVTATVSYMSFAEDASLGQPLRIVLAKPSYVGGDQVNFDKVQLTSDPSEVLAPLAHWKLDDLSGDVATDQFRVHGGRLSAGGAAFASDGVSGGCLTLDASTNGYLLVTNFHDFAANGFSMLAWTKLAPGGARDGSVILSSGYVSGSTNGFAMVVRQPGGANTPMTVRFELNDDPEAGISGPLPDDGLWHQVGVVYVPDENGPMLGNNRASIYIDGVPMGGGTRVAALRGVDSRFVVGGMQIPRTNGSPVGRFTGQLDDVQLYGLQLTTRQFAHLYHTPGRRLGEVEGLIGFSPEQTNFVGSIDVTLNASLLGASIRYTVDGSEPRSTSPLYEASLTLAATTMVKAALFIEQLQVSEVFTATYTRIPAVDFSPAGGFFTNSVSLALVNRLPFGSIFYTVDGTEPSTRSLLYVGAVNLTASATIKARVFESDVAVSEVCRAGFLRVYAVDDGIPMDWRIRYFGAGYLTDPRVAADADPDGDGWNNVVEFQNGTDPTNRASAPQIASGIRAVPLVSWNSVPGLKYRVLRKPSVNAPLWDIVSELIPATGTNTHFIDEGAPPTAVYLIQMVP